MIFRKVHRLAALRVYVATLETIHRDAWPKKPGLANHFLWRDPEYTSAYDKLCNLEEELYITMTIKFTSLKKLYAFQNKLHARGYNLDDYNEYLSTETWKKNNKTIVLLMEA